MRYGIIDVGSNTIRLIIFELKGTEIKIILKEKELSVILSFIQNGNLMEEGLERLLKVLNRFAKICELLGCAEVFCFATASLRKVDNSVYVVSEMKKIVENTEIITGEQEAYYDYIGLSQVVKDRSGMGLDLGGGSVQIFKFKDRQVIESVSLPIGGLEMRNKFVSMVYPTLDEIKEIENCVKSNVKGSRIFKGNNHRVMYLMGGTARAAAKIHRYIYVTKKKSNKYYIPIKELNQLTERFSDPRKSDVDILERILPDRMNNIIPSLVVLNTICTLSGVDEVVVVKNGVRDGYIHDKILPM